MPIFESRNSFITYVTNLTAPEVEKNEFIVSKCYGKNVLDLGCIDHSHQVALSLGDEWLHRKIRTVATRVIGLDILEDDAAQLTRKGYDIRAGNAEDFDLGEQFDVIVAGDLIEHLSNIGMFLRAVKRHMHKDSIFIFSTPNPFNVEQVFSAIFQDKIHVNNQHTVWLSPHVCWELTQREALEIIDFRWINTRFFFWMDGPPWRRLMNRIARAVMKKHPLCKRDFAIVLMLAGSQN